jgi:hypothetical protein
MSQRPTNIQISYQGDKFYEQLIMNSRLSLPMQLKAYWGLTSSSTFPQSTPKIVISVLKW